MLKLNRDSFRTIMESKRRSDEAIQLHHGNSAEVLRTLDQESIDLVVTSPPYDGLRDYKGYTFDFEAIANELARVLKPGGVIVWIVNDATVDGSETGTSFRQALYFKEIGLNLHDTMIWDKQCFVYPNPTRYRSTFEYMFCISKGKPKTINLLSDRKNKNFGKKIGGTSRQVNGDTTSKSGVIKGRLWDEYGVRHNVWEIHPLLSNSERTGHPAAFPIELAMDHIKSWSSPDDRILDCFMGSGTTGIAATMLGRKFTGIEISDEYFKLASERIRLGKKDALQEKSS